MLTEQVKPTMVPKRQVKTEFFRKYGNIGIEIRLTGEYMVFKSFFLKGESFIGKGG